LFFVLPDHTMPLYEYECDACHHRFEVIQKFSDPLIESCPKCGSAVHKLFSSPAIQFKGSGWYITDYARSGKSEPSGTGKAEGSGSAESKGEAKGDSKGESKSESTSDAKTETKSESKPSPPAKS
jgi:putative FmdB family regulatory protein